MRRYSSDGMLTIPPAGGNPPGEIAAAGSNGQRPTRAFASGRPHLANVTYRRRVRAADARRQPTAPAAHVDAATRAAPWFRPDLNKSSAMHYLSRSPDGAFVVWPNGSSFVLSHRLYGATQSWWILATSRGFKLKLGTDEFPSIAALVAHFTRIPRSTRVERQHTRPRPPRPRTVAVFDVQPPRDAAHRCCPPPPAPTINVYYSGGSMPPPAAPPPAPQEEDLVVVEKTRRVIQRTFEPSHSTLEVDVEPNGSYTVDWGTSDHAVADPAPAPSPSSFRDRLKSRLGVEAVSAPTVLEATAVHSGTSRLDALDVRYRQHHRWSPNPHDDEVLRLLAERYTPSRLDATGEVVPPPSAAPSPADVLARLPRDPLLWAPSELARYLQAEGFAGCADIVLDRRIPADAFISRAIESGASLGELGITDAALQQSLHLLVRHLVMQVTAEAADLPVPPPPHRGPPDVEPAQYEVPVPAAAQERPDYDVITSEDEGDQYEEVAAPDEEQRGTEARRLTAEKQAAAQAQAEAERLAAEEQAAAQAEAERIAAKQAAVQAQAEAERLAAEEQAAAQAEAEHIAAEKQAAAQARAEAQQARAEAEAARAAADEAAARIAAERRAQAEAEERAMAEAEAAQAAADEAAARIAAERRAEAEAEERVMAEAEAAQAAADEAAARIAAERQAEAEAAREQAEVEAWEESEAAAAAGATAKVTAAEGEGDEAEPLAVPIWVVVRLQSLFRGRRERIRLRAARDRLVQETWPSARLCTFLDSIGFDQLSSFVAQHSLSGAELLSADVADFADMGLGPAEQAQALRIVHAPRGLPHAVWTPLQVAGWLALLGESLVADAVEGAQLIGSDLEVLTVDDVLELGCSCPAAAARVVRLAKREPPEGGVSSGWHRLDVQAWFHQRKYTIVTDVDGADLLAMEVSDLIELGVPEADAAELWAEIVTPTPPPRMAWNEQQTIHFLTRNGFDKTAAHCKANGLDGSDLLAMEHEDLEPSEADRLMEHIDAGVREEQRVNASLLGTPRADWSSATVQAWLLARGLDAAATNAVQLELSGEDLITADGDVLADLGVPADALDELHTSIHEGAPPLPQADVRDAGAWLGEHASMAAARRSIDMGLTGEDLVQATAGDLDELGVEDSAKEFVLRRLSQVGEQ